MLDTVLVTGSTRGLGEATVEALAERDVSVLCGGRDPEATGRVAARVGGEPVVFDLASLRSVRDAAADLPHVDALACVAGLQFVRGASETADGFEQTFEINHLSHLALIDTLLARPDPPRRIVLVGSGTHDPGIRTGTPDPLGGDVASMARVDAGAEGENARVDGLRRYATSKMLAIAAALGLARERPDLYVIAFDPGLMPGTGLAREYSGPLQLLWNTVLKGLTVFPFASSPAASGRALATLLASANPPVPSGSYVDYRLRVARPSERAGNADFQDAVLRESRELLGDRSPTPE